MERYESETVPGQIGEGLPDGLTEWMPGWLRNLPSQSVSSDDFYESAKELYEVFDWSTSGLSYPNREREYEMNEVEAEGSIRTVSGRVMSLEEYEENGGISEPLDEGSFIEFRTKDLNLRIQLEKRQAMEFLGNTGMEYDVLKAEAEAKGDVPHPVDACVSNSLKEWRRQRAGESFDSYDPEQEEPNNWLGLRGV